MQSIHSEIKSEQDKLRYTNTIREMLRTGKIETIFSVRLNNILIKILSPLTAQQAESLLDLADKLDVRKGALVVAICAHLIQNDIQFVVRHCWSPKLPFFTNVKSLPLPKRLTLGLIKNWDLLKKVDPLQIAAMPKAMDTRLD